MDIGFLASGHFAGFLLGCIFSPYLVRRAGHSRAFAVMAGAAAILILEHPIPPDARIWTATRVVSRFCVAECFTLIEGWLQAKISNENRGRLLSAYRIVEMSGQIMAKAIIATLTLASYISLKYYRHRYVFRHPAAGTAPEQGTKTPQNSSIGDVLRLSRLSTRGIRCHRGRADDRSLRFCRTDFCHCGRSEPVLDRPFPCRVGDQRHDSTGSGTNSRRRAVATFNPARPQHHGKRAMPWDEAADHGPAAYGHSAFLCHVFSIRAEHLSVLFDLRGTSIRLCGE